MILKKADADKPAATTYDNVGSILPPCAASLLLNFAQIERSSGGRKAEDSAWGRKAEELLGGTYSFENLR